jgi:hypothetical protein
VKINVRRILQPAVKTRKRRCRCDENRNHAIK